MVDNIIIKRPSSNVFKKIQNLCLDKGYDFQERLRMESSR